MAGHKELIKKLSEDDSLRQQILDTPTREGKQEAVRNAGLEVPDHHDVLQEVAGGIDDDRSGHRRWRRVGRPLPRPPPSTTDRRNQDRRNAVEVPRPPRRLQEVAGGTTSTAHGRRRNVAVCRRTDRLIAGVAVAIAALSHGWCPAAISAPATSPHQLTIRKRGTPTWPVTRN